MTAQLVSDIHHYDRRLTAALSILDGDKEVLEKNRKKIKEFLEYIRAEGLSTPRQVRYVYVLRKVKAIGRRPDDKKIVSIIEKIPFAEFSKLQDFREKAAFNKQLELLMAAVLKEYSNLTGPSLDQQGSTG